MPAGWHPSESEGVGRGRKRRGFSMRRTLAVAVLVPGWLAGSGARAVGEPNRPAPNAAAVGIGFLYTARSQEVVPRLSSRADFVDLVLGPGRVDVFDKVRPPVRVACISLAVEKNAQRPFPGLKETVDLLRHAGVDPNRVILAYNPERQPGTPAVEMDNLVASVRRARQIAQGYGAELLVGPGLREMQQREHLYPELARLCDIWLIQSQRLQLDANTRRPVAPAQYRQGVRRIVEQLRRGNPRIRVFVQIVTTAERGKTALTADQVAALVLAVEDLVEAARIYGGSPELLAGVIERVRDHRTVPPVPAERPPAGNEPAGSRRSP